MPDGFATYAADRARLDAGETTCEALAEDTLARIEARNDRLNAVLDLDPEAALERARTLDASGADLPLRGLVLGVKNNLAVRGRPLTCGSRMLEHFRSLYTATAVERLEAAGAIVLGLHNCDEFAMGSSNETSYFGAVRNPLDEERVPGGSSGGSAAAVAAGFCHVALGSDTGGSIREPAAFCGTVGLKPTYGRVSRFGLVAHASSLDTVGPLARSVEDAALVLRVMAGADPNDATCADEPVPEYRAALNDDPAEALRGLRVGLPEEYFAEGLDDDSRAALDERIDALRAAGAHVQTVSMPNTHYAVATYYLVSTAEASSNLARYDGLRYGHRAEAVPDDLPGSALDRLVTQNRTEGFGDEVERRILLGTYVLSAGYYDQYYGRAQRARTLIRRGFDAAFKQVDVLLTPASPTPAFRLGEKMEDPMAMYLSDVHTVEANLAGVPALVVPARERHASTGLPVGVQLMAKSFDEATLLRVGHALERI